MCLQGALEFGNRDAFLGTGLDLDSQHVQTVDQFQQAVIRRRLDRNDVAF